jgi:hypothetical protein
MNRITTLSLALLAAAALAGTGCQRRDDATPAPGAGPDTTTTSPGGTSTTPGGGTTTTPGGTSGDAGSMGSTSPAMPPASAASQ